MSTDFRVISIGTLASHPLWNEPADVRTGHATTTLISVGSKTNILVDPSLPPAALLARLAERSNVTPDEITHVFLTSADALHRRALPVFDGAVWLTGEAELDAARASMPAMIDGARKGGDGELVAYLEAELGILRRCRPAPDSLAAGVDLFPLPGVTVGCCGLLLPLPALTVLVCGDAVATAEHLGDAKVLPECHDLEQARESFAEAVQIADVLVPGRDNVLINPVRRLM